MTYKKSLYYSFLSCITQPHLKKTICIAQNQTSPVIVTTEYRSDDYGGLSKNYPKIYLKIPSGGGCLTTYRIVFYHQEIPRQASKNFLQRAAKTFLPASGRGIDWVFFDDFFYPIGSKSPPPTPFIA